MIPKGGLRSPFGAFSGSSRRTSLLLAFGASGMAKAASFSTSILLVSLCVGYLGADRFGILMAILSIAVFLSFFDLGISNSAMNSFSKLHSVGDRAGLSESFAGVFGTLVLVSGLQIALFLGVVGFLDLPRFFSVPPSLRGEFLNALTAFVVVLLCTQPFTLAQRLRLALQQSWVSSLWEIAGVAASLLALVVASLHQASVVWLAVAVASGNLVANLGNFLGLAARGWSVRAPRWRADLARLRPLVGPSLGFLSLQAAGSLAFGMDGMILLKYLGTESSGIFAVHQRLFQIVPVMAGFLFLPLWPMYTAAVAKGDFAWLRSTYTKVALGTTLAGGLGCLALVPVTAAFIPSWSRGVIAPDLALLGWLATWSFYMLISSSNSILLNAANRIWPQVWVSAAMVAVSWAGKLLLLPRLGIHAIPLVNLLANVLIVYVPMLVLAIHVLRRGGHARPV